MYSAGNGQCEHYDCSNRTGHGYCKTSVCINPIYSTIGNERSRLYCSYWESAQIEDAVYVVRCKDCENAIDIGREYLLCPMIDCRVKANFFCAYGERKKNGN